MLESVGAGLTAMGSGAADMAVEGAGALAAGAGDAAIGLAGDAAAGTLAVGAIRVVLPENPLMAGGAVAVAGKALLVAVVGCMHV